MSPPVSHILVREVNWIGDAVMTLPALTALRRFFPEARVTVLARPWVADLFLHHPAVDEILAYEHQGRHRGMAGKIRLAGELRRQRFDLALLFQNALDAAVLSFLARIPERVGYDRDGRRILLTRAVPLRPDHRVRHHVDYYQDLIQGWIGLDPRVDGRIFPMLHLSVEEQGWARDLVARESLSGPGFIGINPGATYGSSKRWLPERFAAVADRLHEIFGHGIVIFGGPSETTIAEEIAHLMKTPALVMAGRTSVRELMALIALSRLFITNDSGPMHVAAALGRPVVALFGSTSPEATGPYSDSVRVVRARGLECVPCFLRECPDRDLACMKNITMEEVVEASIDLIKATASAPP